jgi:hypothetical protein
MNAGSFSLIVLALLPLCGASPRSLAADAASSAAKLAERPEARRPFRELSPEERETRFKEMQERFGPAPFTFEELKTMPPEERQAKLRQWREGRFSFSPEERQSRRAQIKQRLLRQIGDLQKKKAARTMTEEERLRLERLELIASRFDRVGRPAPSVLGTPSKESNGMAPAKKVK